MNDGDVPEDPAPTGRRARVRRVLGWTGIGLAGLVGLFLAWVVVLLATNPGARSTDAWVRGADMPSDRTEVGSTVIDTADGEHLVVTGGFGAPLFRTRPTAYRWDPDADEWSRLPDMPGGRHHHAAAAHDGAVYVSGGGSSALDWDPRTNLWVLRPGADDWEALPDLPEGRLGHRMAVIDGRLVLVGGEGPTGRVLAFDLDAGTWSVGSAIPVPRDHVGSVTVDGEVWVIGGRNDDVGLVTRIDIYDPVADAWRAGPPLPREISAAVTGVVDGRVHVVGGEDPGLFGGRAFAAHYVYDLAAGAWAEGPLPIFDVHGAGGGVVEGELVIAGGARRQGALSTLGLTGATQRFVG